MSNNIKFFFSILRVSSISVVCGIMLVFSIASLGAQESTKEQVQSTGESEIDDIQEFVVVPLLQTLPTMASLTARTIYNNINVETNERIKLNIVFGENVAMLQVPTLLDKYLLEYDYDSVIFVAATSQIDQENEIGNIGGLEGTKNSLEDFIVDIQIYHKGSTEAIYTEQYQNNLARLKESTSSKQSKIATENEKQEYKNLFAIIETIIEEIQYITIYINPEAETRPEYILKINKEPVFFSDYKKGVAYLSLANQKVFVYQILAGEEVLVKQFRAKRNTAKQSFEVRFIDPNKPREASDDRISTDLLGGYIQPLINTDDSVFHPSVVAISRIQHRTQWGNIGGYMGSTVLFTGFSILPSADYIVSSRYGIYGNTGLDFNITRNTVFHTGLEIGALFLTATSIDDFNYIPETIVPSVGVDLGFTHHILAKKSGSMRIIMELAGLSAYYTGPFASSDTNFYIAGQANLGLGVRF